MSPLDAARWAGIWHAQLRQLVGAATQPARTLSGVLDVHRPIQDGAVHRCYGCHTPGAVPPVWPCTTVLFIAEVSGLPMRMRCPTCSTRDGRPLRDVWPDGRLLTHPAPGQPGRACRHSLSHGLHPNDPADHPRFTSPA